MFTATYSNLSIGPAIDPIAKYDEALLAHLGDEPVRVRSGTTWRDAWIMLTVGVLLFAAGIALVGWLPAQHLSADAIEQLLQSQ